MVSIRSSLYSEVDLVASKPLQLVRKQRIAERRSRNEGRLPIPSAGFQTTAAIRLRGGGAGPHLGPRPALCLLRVRRIERIHPSSLCILVPRRQGGLVGVEACQPSQLNSVLSRSNSCAKIVPGARRLAIMANDGYPAAQLELREHEQRSGGASPKAGETTFTRRILGSDIHAEPPEGVRRAPSV